jgi:hypothetical protein
MVLNRKVLAIIGGTAAVAVWMRKWKKTRRRTITRRARGMLAGMMLVIAGTATRWKAVRSVSKRIGIGLIESAVEM